MLGMSRGAFHPGSAGEMPISHKPAAPTSATRAAVGREPSGKCMWVYPVGSFQLFLCVCADPTTEPGTGLNLPVV